MLVGIAYNSWRPQNINLIFKSDANIYFPHYCSHEPNFGMPFFKRTFPFSAFKNCFNHTSSTYYLKVDVRKFFPKIYDVKKVPSQKQCMEAHTCRRKGNLIFTGRRFRYVSSPSKIDISNADLSGKLH